MMMVMTELFAAKTEDEQAQQTGALPLFMQITELVARQIAAGHLSPDSKLPPERDMAKDYGVAVGTLRKSLAQLTELGLITRKQGSGNYISRNEHAASLYSFFRLELLSGGGLPSARLLDVTRLQKPEDLPEFGSASFANLFRRVRYLDDEAVALEEIWLDGSCACQISNDDISDSLYHFYRTRLGIWITKAEDWIGIDNPPAWYKGQIESQMGFIERFGWSNEGKKIEYSRTWYAPEKARYVSRLK